VKRVTYGYRGEQAQDQRWHFPPLLLNEKNRDAANGGDSAARPDSHDDAT
jgi:hypothetical protein